MTNFRPIPKHIMTDIFIGKGPWKGNYARPCFCGKEIDLDEEVILIATMDGEAMVCHPECVKGMIPDA